MYVNIHIYIYSWACLTEIPPAGGCQDSKGRPGQALKIQAGNLKGERPGGERSAVPLLNIMRSCV